MSDLLTFPDGRKIIGRVVITLTEDEEVEVEIFDVDIECAIEMIETAREAVEENAYEYTPQH